MTDCDKVVAGSVRVPDPVRVSELCGESVAVNVGLLPSGRVQVLVNVFVPDVVNETELKVGQVIDCVPPENTTEPEL